MALTFSVQSIVPAKNICVSKNDALNRVETENSGNSKRESGQTTCSNLVIYAQQENSNICPIEVNIPELSLTDLEEFVKQPFRAEFVKAVVEKAAIAAAGKDSWAVSEYIAMHKDQPYAREVLLEAAKQNPRSVYNYANSYKDQPYAKEILIKAAEQSPVSALEFASLYKEQPYAPEIIKKAAITAVGMAPWHTLLYVDSYKDQACAREILLKAAKRNPEAALLFADRYEDKPYAKEIIDVAKGKLGQK